MIRNADTDPQCSLVHAKTIGLRVPPICPAVFIAALETPAFRPARSTHAPQLAPSKKFELAAPSPMKHAEEMKGEQLPRLLQPGKPQPARRLLPRSGRPEIHPAASDSPWSSRVADRPQR